jgi:hypothetical protein
VLVTLPIPILLALLAQAEPAPADTTAQPAAEAAPAPAAEPAAGAEPAPAPEPPPTALPPAEPEPEHGVQSTSDSDPQMMLGFRAGADFQLTGVVPPKLGYSFSPFFQYDYARLIDRLALGLRAEFTFDRFQKLVTAQADVGGDVSQSYQTTRTLSFFDFALLATATLHLHPLQPWVAAGMGMTIGNFHTPEAKYQPGESRATWPLVLGAFGLDVAVGRGALVGLHVEYRSLLVKSSFLLATGQRIDVFGDRMSVAAALLYQF